MTKKGFTIIELLIVIAIIGILVGVAVPYYNDYIYDARLSTLKQNLATYRQVLNQFRGDNLRGPFAVPVNNGAVPLLVDPKSGNTTGSELIAGPIQLDGTFKRRSNLNYLQAMPIFISPNDGSPVPPAKISLATPTAYFYDTAAPVGIFNIDVEFAFTDNDGDQVYDISTDTQIINSVASPAGPLAAPLALDHTGIIVDIDGVIY